MNDLMQLIATKKFSEKDEMYKIIDYMNKSMTEYGFIFGISQHEDKYVINIYKSN